MGGVGAIDSELLGGLFATAPMRAIWNDAARLQAMLDFEAALARVQSRLGVVPHAVGEAVARAARAHLYDPAEIGAKVPLGGNVAIPLVKALTERVKGEAAGFVHWGATSQDVIDTGLMLQAREGLRLLRADLVRLGNACAMLADAHRATPMAGRTFLQQGLPTVFGLKAASWLESVQRLVSRIDGVMEHSLALQFGGAVGTLASLGPHGAQVRDELAVELKLHAPAVPWFTTRERIAEIGEAVGAVAGIMMKVAGDIVLMMQTEVGEVFEPAAPGKGGSSTMPHKRNPVGAATARGAALQAQARAAALSSTMDQPHERATGGWQAEWGLVPELFVLTAAAVQPLVTVLEGLEVRAERMRENLEITRGLVFAEAVMMKLAPKTGRGVAHHILEAASKQAVAENRHLRDVLKESEAVAAHLGAKEIDAVFDPLGYVGSADVFIDRALGAWREAREDERPDDHGEAVQGI
ncbi:3-carboxy-cis,cis-muconate cycloisomerase [Breoghania corrubedonensis]|uniref:3-carboxy-cis,cis-muconate cycloisomerase n=1 Tax=Breoghania corrubedonensis TaxID=665038 RepID=A0A2T5VDA5_9HYPH|nr:3-carboxy-cis,cis-muconate cycloisomerase [Breoghania corrubedonensis]PTW61716.1 3-carboxy-cis,cis-muconate cycloisomerase [Breoghania corrubedonensis]